MGSSAATIVIDGKVIVAIEEERLTRLKNDGGFPYKSIEYCLEATNLKIEDIDKIAVYWQPWRIHNRTIQVLISILKDPKNLLNSFNRGVQAIFGVRDKFNKYPELRGSWLELFYLKKILNKYFGNSNSKVEYFDHHMCHAASIYYISDFENAICLTYDGGGETASTVIFSIENQKFYKLKSINWPNSLGHYYSAFTGFLGFRMLEGEYKMMGLSSYGNSNNNLSKFFKNGRGDRDIFLYQPGFSGYIDIFSSPELKLENNPEEWHRDSSKITNLEKDMAYNMQQESQELVGDLVEKAIELTGQTNICITGGYGLNCVANYYMLKRFPNINFYHEPLAHDAGNSIGAALYRWYEYSGDTTIRPRKTLYNGPQYTKDELINGIKNYI